MAPMGLGLEGMALGGGVSRASAALPYWINLTPATTSKIKAGYDAMMAGTRNMNIAWTGSSVDRGVDETAVPYNSQYALSVAEQMAALFRGDGIASGANNWYGISGNNFADYMARDGRCIATGSATSGVTAVPCQGGSELEFPTAAGTFSFTPQKNTNTADIYYQDSTAGRAFTWSVDGGATTTITTTGANTIAKATIPLGSVGPHTITLAWSAGFVRIYGIDCYDNTRKEVTVRQWATSGGTVSGMIDNSGAPSAGRLRQIQLFAPDVIMGDIGLPNTWRAPAVSVATAKSQAETYIDAIQAAGADFILVVPPFDSGSAGNTANQQAYIDAVVASCIAKGCAVFNLRAAPGWTSKAASDAAGFTVSGDAIHKTIAGQANTAALLKDGMYQAMGASPVLAGDVNIDFTKMANGAPGLAVTGETIDLDYAGVGNGTVSGGAFVVTTASATYNSVVCREDIKRMMADVSFSDANDVVALICTPGPKQAAVGATSLHLAFNPAGWVLSYFSQDTAGTITKVDEASGGFPAAAYGSVVRCGFELAAGGVYITVPDKRLGTKTSFIAAPQSAIRTNHVMMFEHYRNGGGAPGCKFYRVAADLFASPAEAGRTNLFVSPTDYTNAAWVKDGLGTPTNDGNPGQKLLETASLGYHWLYQNIASVPGTPTRMALRFKARLIGEDIARIVAYDGALSGAAQKYRNVTTRTDGTGPPGTFTNQYFSDIDLGNGLHQFQLEFLTNPTAAGLYAALGVVRAADGSADQFTGDVAKGFAITDAQLFVRPT